jgi:hypothetical protein
VTRRALALVCALAAVAFSGCISIKAVQLSQFNPGGTLHFLITLCATDQGAPPGNDSQPDIDHEGCNFPSNSGEPFSGMDPVENQLLLAVRVPAGTGAPETLTGSEPEPGKPITFTRSPSYEAELNKFLPPGAGRQWLGWISNQYDYLEGTVDVTAARQTSIPVDLTLPPGEGGGPSPSPFRFRWVAGGRGVFPPALPATRPVDCGETVYPIEGSATLCIDSPSPAIVDGADEQFNSRDFGITSPSAEGSPGQSFVLPFILATSGILGGGGPTASLTASSNLPGLGGVPNPASVQLANDLRQRVEVPVTIPPGTPPGTYDVSVTAALPTGESRTGVAKLTVRDRQDPVLRGLRLRPKRIRPGAPSLVQAAAGATVRFTLSEEASVRFTVQRKRGRRFRKLRGSFKHAGQAGANQVRFTGFLRGKPLRRGSYRLVATPTDGAGNKGAARRVGFRIRG